MRWFPAVSGHTRSGIADRTALLGNGAGDRAVSRRAAPCSWYPLELIHRPLIASNGSREAARAVGFATRRGYVEIFAATERPGARLKFERVSISL